MKISVLTPDTVKWPVRIVIPSGNGSTQNLKMTGVFRLLTGDELRELEASITSLRDGDRDADGRIVNRDAAFARRVLVGWENVEGEDGEPLPCNDETRDALLRSHHAAKGVCEGFYDMMNGRKAKN